MPKAVRLSKREHPLYSDYVDLWNLYLNAVKGGKNFANESNIFSHRLEDTDDYDERIDRAYFLNFCESIPKLYNTYIFKERIERPSDPVLEQFRKNTDLRGTDITTFVRRCGFLSSVLGTIHALVDITPTNKKRLTRADERKIQPYCTIVYPTQLKDWSIDRFGELQWVVIETTYYRDIDPTVERTEEVHYTLITRKEWRVEDDKGNQVVFEDGSPASGQNKLGKVPLVTLYHEDIDGNLIGESMLKDIVYINRIILNWCSCIDEQIERQTFSQLVVPDDGSLAEEDETSDDPLYRIGTSSIWTFPASSTHAPQFISPNTENIRTIWNLVVDHIKEIYRLAGLLGTSSDIYMGRSGRAAQMGFVGVNAALANKAAAYQRFENEISKLAYMQLGKDPSKFEEVRYADNFDVSALSDEIESTFKIMERNFSETLNKTLMKNLARRAIPLAPQTVVQQVEKEIESGTGEVKPAYVPDKVKDDGSGNPNVNDKDTFQSKDELDTKNLDKKKVDQAGLE